MRLLVDVDGTLRDTWGAVNEYILERTGVELPAVWPHYNIARQTVGDEIADEAFKATCADYERDHWYPGVWDALVAMRRGGVTPVICTMNPYRQARTIRRALSPLYGAPLYVERVKSSGAKLAVAKRIAAVGIVDDKPATLEAFNAAGYFTATYDQPYNGDIKVDCRFSDWREVDLAYEVQRRVWWQMTIESEAEYGEYSVHR